MVELLWLGHSLTIFTLSLNFRQTQTFWQLYPLFVQSYVCLAASTMENKKLLILASIRQPMADHSNKVQRLNTQYIMIETIPCSLWVCFVFIRKHSYVWTLVSSQVKKCVVQVISAMAHHGYLELEGGELLVRFIVQNCALPDTYQVRYIFTFEWPSYQWIIVFWYNYGRVNCSFFLLWTNYAFRKCTRLTHWLFWKDS